MLSIIQEPGLTYWLLLSTVLFSIGLYGFFTRTNAIGILISVELMLNAAAISFVSFNNFAVTGDLDGQIMTMFIIAVAAAEVVIGMAIFIQIFSKQRHLNVTKMNELSR
ncbi:MAG: NADH-quinone oxidoreductase subunit NuoK [Bdellovibrionaceae bacterium]|jgi:NADH-quinone oxidoreductase subunit K|nr:NADH-quinone oxidoreductase subunit NuoK [Pseudobdellovibrionaceae bacterium]